ncbi:zf-RVT domain-containing protein [Cephalotus follicularis]|uniref:Zf-RVT domain-containing protein n=1 Tax=Cephalotus follicularis TaxID=3775 RepID=A0A1Q3BPU7_CEPFO|nr:zf-RVT domain-containing protein [Cephalotus follicularis]
MWKWLWSLNIPPKIRLFGWKCCRNILPTNLSLAKRMPQKDPMCRICQGEEESIMHALFHYHWASKVWDDSNLSIMDELAKSKNLGTLFSTISVKLREEVRLLWVVA